jgi:beta-glucanase (GH16 family)
MKRLTTRAIILAAALAVAGTVAYALALGVTSHGEWRRVFFDDFSRGLRASRWGKYTGQPGGDPGGWWAPSHVVVSNGVLNLETYRDPRYGGRWVSGGVSSAPALKQKYGRYEVRLRMDPGQGIGFTALLWPVGDEWPPEIDFAENGGETNARRTLSATLHYGHDDSQIQRTTRLDLTRWHTLGVEWLPGKLVYTVDGRPWAVLISSEVPAQRMEMDLQAQAGTCGARYAPCPTTRTPARVDAQIAWVAAYAYQPNGS